MALITYLTRILENGKHLLTLINQVLDLSKVEAGKMELELAPVALDVLVRETLGQLEGRVLGKEVKLLAQLPPVLAPVETDAGKLKQVLINLIGNALKFTEQGSVTVQVVPWPGVLSSSMVPPWAWMMLRAMLRPRPVPPCSRLRALSTR